MTSLRKIQIAIATLLITTIDFIQSSEDTLTSSALCKEAPAPESYSESCGQFFFGADLLYLRSFEGGLSNVCDNTSITESDENGIIISSLKGKNHDPNFKWNLGFCIDAGYEFPNNCEIGANWTHYNAKTHWGKNHVNENLWKINFDVVDVLYGYECDLSTCLALTPFGGLRYASINQKLHTNFENKISSVTDPTPYSFSSDSFSGEEVRTTSSRNIKEKFFGIGPLFGIEGDLNIGCGFSLYGNVSIATLFGTFHVQSNQIENFDTGNNITDLRKRIQACQAVVDAGFGVRWKTCFCDEKILMLQLSLEQHRYFNHNQFCSYGDLILDGLSLAVILEF